MFINEVSTTQAEIASVPGSDLSGFVVGCYSYSDSGGPTLKGDVALPAESTGFDVVSLPAGTNLVAIFDSADQLVDGWMFFDNWGEPGYVDRGGAYPDIPQAVWPGTGSAQRVGAGSYDDFSTFTWQASEATSFGAVNDGQSIAGGEPDPDPDPDPEPIPGVVTGAMVAAFLGQEEADLIALADQHVVVVTAMARAYTRGNGFVDGVAVPDVAAVILAATARLVANPEQIESQVGSVAMRAGFKGWNLLERTILNEYRRVAR